MSDRFRESFESLVFALLPKLANLAQWTYRVQAVSPGPPVKISGSPVNTRNPFGNLANIVLWPGPTGGYAIPVVGSLILVRFNDGDPTQPAVCGLDPVNTPTMTTLAGGGPPIARLGDAVQLPAMVAGGNPVTIGGAGSPINGQITGGSPRAVCG